MEKKLAQFVDIVMKDPAVESANGFLGGGTTNTGRMFVALKPLGERKATADQVIARLRGKLAHVPGASSLPPARAGPADRRARRAPRSTSTRSRATTSKELYDWAPRVFAAVEKLPGLADVNSDQQNRTASRRRS